MKKTLLAAMVGTMLFAGSAFAETFWTGGLYNGSGFTTGIQGLDWNVGSGLATGLGTNNAADPDKFLTAKNSGTTFNFMYQASMVGVTGSNGQSVLFPGLNSSFEYTIVASIPEKIVGTTTVGPVTTALFQTQAGGKAYLYYDGNINSVVSSGYGFDDGQLVAAFDIAAGQITSFTATGATQGIGSSILYGDLIAGSLNTSLITVDANTLWNIGTFRGEGTQNTPAGVIPTDFFTGRDAGNLDPYNVTQADLPMNVDYSNKFQPVPEPSTLVLLGMGLFGAACFARRKMQG